MRTSLYKPHPWHGVPIGDEAPRVVVCFIEIVPTDTVKYEIDKLTGYLKVDRPQKFSNVCPTLYGMIPRTLCGERVGAFCAERSGRTLAGGDADPMDICVLTEKQFPRGDILLHAAPIGGLRLIDNQQADDKIIAVLEGDAAFGGWRDIGECPPGLLERLQHYFLTYKQPPGESHPRCELAGVYGADEAQEVIRRSVEDYRAEFGHLQAI
ncbi:MAG: inorganic pyrophosphatase [Candidatus Acidiferrales bacterium]